MNDDGMDGLDRELQAAGSRWRDRQRPAPGVDLAALTGSGRARWVAPVAAAVAVATIVGGGAVLLGGGDDDAEPRPGGSSTGERSGVPEIVVPWADLPAAHEEIPVPVRQWEPAPDYAAGEPTCTSEQVELVPGFMLDEGVIPYTEISVNAKPGERCAMPTDADLTFRTGNEGGGAAGVRAEGAGEAAGWPGEAVLLQGEGNGYISASWAGDSCAAGEGAGRARVLALAWQGGEVTASIPERFGRGPEGDLEPQPQPACLTADLDLRLMSPLTTLGAGEVTPPSPYDTVQIEQVGHEPAAEDGLETWLVQLTASGEEIPLGDCPDARVTHSYTDADGALRDDRHRYRMNCDWSGLPHDSQGDPVLPVGVPVAFTVKAPAPSPGAGEQLFESSWTLLGPNPLGIILERTLDQTQGPELPAIVPEEEAELLLDVGNESEARYLDFQVLVDGLVVADEEVWNGEDDGSAMSPAPKVTLPLALGPGEHELTLESELASRTVTVVIQGEGPLYASASVFEYEGEEPEWSWAVQGEPFAYL